MRDFHCYLNLGIPEKAKDRSSRKHKRQTRDKSRDKRAISSLFSFTWHYHRRHGTVGHVWQGRFKSPVIQDDDHLLVVLRYIEGNPLRAGMVTDLKDYAWSSYGCHGLRRADPLLSELPVWSRLGSTEEVLQTRWREWVHEPLTARELAAVRRSVTSGRPFGEETWVQTAAACLGLELATRRRGRPRKLTNK